MPEIKQHTESVDWQAESFRLTAFLSPSAQISEQDWWKILTSEVPDRKTSEPKIGLQQEEGKFKDEKIEGNLVLTVQPTRVDWQLVPLLDMFTSGFPTLGSFADSLESFLTLMLRWTELAPSIQRLAFGSVLTKSVNSSKEGYQWVSSYLPFDLDEDSSDFLYQINRPIKSKFIKNPDLFINRLSKWSVNLLAGFDFDPIRPEQYISRSPQFSVRLELDINTTTNLSAELNSEQLPQVFQELVELGKEIAIQGDRK
jgi:hypothetical protein